VKNSLNCSEPFGSLIEAQAHKAAWEGQFSIFTDLEIVEVKKV
jgi:hypothetical protein